MFNSESAPLKSTENLPSLVPRFTGGSEASTASELDVDEIFSSMGQVDLMGTGMKKTGDVLMGFHGVLIGYNWF